MVARPWTVPHPPQGCRNLASGPTAPVSFLQRHWRAAWCWFRFCHLIPPCSHFWRLKLKIKVVGAVAYFWGTGTHKDGKDGRKQAPMSCPQPCPHTVPSSPARHLLFLPRHGSSPPNADKFRGLVDYLHCVFADELARGQTYPQEILPGQNYTRAQFDAYYFAADVLVAVLGLPTPDGMTDPLDAPDGTEVPIGFAEAVGGRTWEECIAGCYYVKPNYPGRSSHICNAGFLVPPIQRGHGIGTVLARSYLHYGPRLGYEASVFNLVYVNNVASVKLWEALDFIKAGRIPRAGRLKKADGDGEEFVDAWIFYRRFDPLPL